MIEEHGQWLLANMYATTGKGGRRKSTTGEIQQRLAEVTNTLSDLNDEINARRNKISAVLSDAVSFDQSVADLDKWLSGVEKKQDNQKSISTDPEEVKEQVLENKDVCDDINQHEPVYNSILNSAKTLLGTNPEKSKDLSKKLKDLTDRYEKVKDTAKKRDNDLTKMLPVTRDFSNNNKVVEDVIKEGEAVLQSVQPVGIDTEKGNTDSKKLKVFYSVNCPRKNDHIGGFFHTFVVL